MNNIKTVLQFEIDKLIHRRITLVLAIITVLLFPAVIKIMSHWLVIQQTVAEGSFAESVSYSIISYSQIYFFIPVWILIFTGQELSNGHVNRVVFIRSKQFYFLSKFSYCIIIIIFFTLIGVISFLICIYTSPYPELVLSPTFYLKFIVQLLFSNLSFSVLLFSLAVTFRSPIIAFVIYIVASFLEGMLFLIIDGEFGVEVWWLPFHLVRTVFTRNGELKLENYYNPLFADMGQIALVVAFTLLLLAGSYIIFIRTELKSLSD